MCSALSCSSSFPCSVARSSSSCSQFSVLPKQSRRTFKISETEYWPLYCVCHVVCVDVLIFKYNLLSSEAAYSDLVSHLKDTVHGIDWTPWAGLAASLLLWWAALRLSVTPTEMIRPSPSTTQPGVCGTFLSACTNMEGNNHIKIFTMFTKCNIEILT